MDAHNADQTPDNLAACRPKVAFLFPGQGSQKVGMGAAIAQASPEAKAVFDAADAVIRDAMGGPAISELCFQGPVEALKQTIHTQPALLSTSIALWRALDRDPDITAGHSLGEYSAIVAAGALPFEHAVRLVRLRGQFMQEAVPEGAGAMVAVLGLDEPTVEAICQASEGVAEAVNYNCPGQLVVAGEAAAIGQVAEQVKEAGGRAIPLPVSAPFHSSMMRPAEARLSPFLVDAPWSDARLPVVSNVDAVARTDAGGLREAVTRQVSMPVQWTQTIRNLRAMGVSLFVEIGAGKVLTGLVGRIDKEVARINVEGPEDIKSAREMIDTARGLG